MVVNIILTIAAIALAIALVCGVAILIIFAHLLVQMDKKKHENDPIVPEPTFYGRSRMELEMTTAKLLREDKRRPRKRHAQIIIV